MARSCSGHCAAAIALGFLVLVAMPSIAMSGNPCEKAASLWKERHAKDIELRLRAIHLKGQVQEGQRKALELEKAMVEVKKEILAAPGELRGELWKRYDDLSDERDAIVEKIEPLQQESSDIRFKRSELKLKSSIQEIAEEEDCAVNDALTDRLASLRARPDLPATTRAGIEALAERRAKLVAEAKSRYGAFRKQADANLAEYRQQSDALKTSIAREVNQEKALDEKADKISAAFDAFVEELARTSEELARLSEQLLRQVEARAE